MSKNIKAVEIFSVGVWNGVKITMQHLDAMVTAFKDVGFMPPLKIGHTEKQTILQRDGLPAAGWVEKLYRVGEKLIADFKDIPDSVATWIKEGKYRQISPEVFSNYTIEGKTYLRVLKAVALLGADNPATLNLKPIDPATLYTTNNEGCEIFYIDNYSEWGPVYIQELPNESFAFIALYGKDNNEMRLFPHHDKNGKVNWKQLQNCITELPICNFTLVDEYKREIAEHLQKHFKEIYAEQYSFLNNDSKDKDYNWFETFAVEGVQFVIGRLKGKVTTEVQTVIFDKNNWTTTSAKAWLQKHNMHFGKVDITENSLRYRQKNPEDFEPGSFRTISVGQRDSDNSKTDVKNNSDANSRNTQNKGINNMPEDKKNDKNTDSQNTDSNDQATEFSTEIASIKTDMEKIKAENKAKDEKIKAMELENAQFSINANNKDVGNFISGLIKDGKLYPKDQSKAFTLLSTLANKLPNTLKFTVDKKEVEMSPLDIAKELFTSAQSVIELDETGKKVNKDDTTDKSLEERVDEKVKKYMTDNKMKANEYGEAQLQVFSDDLDLKKEYEASFLK